MPLKELKVIKRDNRVETLDITKIHKYTSSATKGLDGVSQSELEVDAKIQFRDLITTSEIQQTLIQTAVSKIDIDRPNWTFVASRLFLYDLYHKVHHFKGYPTLEEYFQKGEDEGRLVKGLREKYDLDELNSYIKPERDLQFTYLGIKTLYDRYLLKDREGNPIELPQHMFMAIAMFLAQKEDNKDEWAKKFYDLISKFEVMVATPTLSNSRTPRHQLSSCYVMSVNDNIEGIFDSFKEMALLSKYGGGIGADWSKIRALGSYIDGHKNAAGGIIPWLRITNDVAIAVDQLGTRKGAISVYIEPWHSDIGDFLDLKRNAGEERRRAHDLFPALWICDIFMERVLEDREWTLFDPNEVSDLTDIYGDEFKKRYIEYEARDDIYKERIKAKDLWKKILVSYFETGSPFLCFKDNANSVNPNRHDGVIRSSNLCIEIYQNTEPNRYRVKVLYENGDIEYFNENDEVTTDEGVKKSASKITSIDRVGNRGVYFIEKEMIEGKTAVCNLASVNLSKINKREDIERVIPTAVRMLDNVIDLNFYPVKKTKDTNHETRAIGLGVMGEAQFLAENSITWGSKKHLEEVDRIMEAVSFNTIKSSMEIAKEKGHYRTFEGSNWSKGIFPIDLANSNAKALTKESFNYNWDSLREDVKKYGVRNGYLMAIAPTSSISIVSGTTQTIEPVYKRKWFEENLSGLIPVVVPNLNSETWQYYSPAYDLNQVDLVKVASIRQKWIDQGQSLNIFISLDRASAKYLHEIYTTAWKFGLKGTYYLRSQSPEARGDIADRSVECEGCQ